MITYTVYSNTEIYDYKDGHSDNIVSRGGAKTLAAAKRKARSDAKDTLNQATIHYYANGEMIFAEINDYGICEEISEYEENEQ